MLMLTVALAAVALAVVLYQQHLARKDRLAAEKRLDKVMAQHHLHIASLLVEKNPDLEQMVSLVDRLCQRVQAPAQAVIDHSLGLDTVPPSPPAVGFDDDEAFHAARELSKDALADALMDAEVASVAG